MIVIFISNARSVDNAPGTLSDNTPHCFACEGGVIFSVYVEYIRLLSKYVAGTYQATPKIVQAMQTMNLRIA